MIYDIAIETEPKNYHAFDVVLLFTFSLSPALSPTYTFFTSASSRISYMHCYGDMYTCDKLKSPVNEKFFENFFPEAQLLGTVFESPQRKRTDKKTTFFLLTLLRFF